MTVTNLTKSTDKNNSTACCLVVLKFYTLVHYGPRAASATAIIVKYKQLRYREEHGVSVLFSWCTL